jgi:diaminopimelate decarboxylase
MSFNPHLWPVTAGIDTQDRMTIAGCVVVDLARQFGTPLYVLDEATIQAAAASYRTALAELYPRPSAIHYAAKALLNVPLVGVMRSAGLGLDVASGGELAVGLRGNMPADLIHLHGNAKPRVELAAAVAGGIGSIVLDNLDELDCLIALTAEMTRGQEIMLRIAPDIAADTHPHIATGARNAKFGLTLDALDEAVSRVKKSPWLKLRGLHLHLGSQIGNIAPYGAAADVLIAQSAMLKERHGIVIDTISPGGGLGISYTDADDIATISQLVRVVAAATTRAAAKHNFPPPRLVLEPGRSIIGRAGIAVYSIIARKKLSETDGYLHVDGGIGDNIRPALYGARYSIAWPGRMSAATTHRASIAGRYCESSDVLVRDIAAPADAKPCELIAVAGAGAYTLAMANIYNLVPRPALVLAAEGQAQLIQRRETYDDLMARDIALHGPRGGSEHAEETAA